MTSETPRMPGPAPVSQRLWLVVVAASLLLSSLTLGLVSDPLLARSSCVAGLCLILWLSEVVPPHVPTFLLWGLTPLLLSPLNSVFSLPRVFSWSADPVLAVFLGGFVISAAARRHGLDAWIAHKAVTFAAGRRLTLLLVTSSVTALLSMWMSNVAATAMTIVAIHPVTASLPREDPFRRALLLGLAMGANFGGIATPVGTGPNAIAIAAAAGSHEISFLEWMAFALPAALCLLAASLFLIRWRYGVAGLCELPPLRKEPVTRPARHVVMLTLVTIFAWLSETWHGVPAPAVALLSSTLFFGFGLLGRHDLSRIDWSTLFLIAGGIALGHLLQESGLLETVSHGIPWDTVSPTLRLLGFCLICALLAAVMSNTATATVLIPLVSSFDPSVSTIVLVALSASLGVPFVISTPPNAMVFGEGGMRSSDFLFPGLLLMALGLLAFALVGPAYLRLMGLP